MSDKHSFFLKLIRGIEGEAQRSEAAANIACDRVNSISKSLRASEQRHEKVLNSLKIAEAKAADLFFQQSKTRKKLFSLYSSLQSVLAKSIDNASALSSKKSVDSEVGMYHVGMTPLLWWRISVLYSFNVGNISEFTRHASLRKEAEILSRDGADGSHCDNIMPICQYFLLGTCLDEKCPYSHPSPHLGGTGVQAMKKSKDSHFAWILEKHRQYLSKFSEEQSHKNSYSQKSNAQNHDADQHILNSDSVQNGGNSNCTEIRSVREELLKKKDLSGRYFNEILSSNLGGDGSMTNSEQGSWAQRFIEQCKAALVKHIGTYEKAQGWVSADCNQFLSSSTDLPFSSTVVATIEQKLLSRFCFNLLYGLSYKNQKQRDICIRSCLQILKPYLDDSPSISPSLTEAWKLFLILSIEGDIITPNICLQYWEKLVLHLEKLLSQSLSVQPLLAAVCCKVADAAEYADTETLSNASAGVGKGTGPGVCERYSVQSTPLKILGSLWELERLCDGGRTEVALEALCTHLLLPSPFEMSHLSPLDLQCLPRDIAFATFFVLILTGQFVGRKLFYSRDLLLLMSHEINAIAGTRVRNLFRRSPFLREFVRDAFLACFKSLNAFRHFGTVLIDIRGDRSKGPSHLPESPNVKTNSGECEGPAAPLSSVHQTIIWSYLLLLHCATGEDQVPLKSYQLEDVHRFCDCLCYPGVYEGAAALTSASSDRSSVHRSDLHSALGMSTVAAEQSSTFPSNAAFSSPSSSSSYSTLSVQLMLMSALDSYLLSADSNTASLESSLCAARPMTDNATHPSLPQVELNVHTLVSELWTTLDNLCHPASSLDVVCALGNWTVKVSRSNTLCTASHISRFTVDFVAQCRTYLDEKMSRLAPALFLNILSIQVLMVAKAACSFSRDHSTSVHLIEMVLVLNELTLRIEQSISTTEGAGTGTGEGNAAECLDTGSIGKEKDIPEVMRKRKRGGIELAVQAVMGQNTGDSMQMQCGDIPSLDCCTAELDCVGPISQTRLLTRTLDLLDAHGMMSYNIVELLFQRAVPLRGSADLLVQWILDWFRDSSTQQDRQDDPESSPDAEQGRGVVSCDMIPPSTSLKDSILIATAFQNSRCASSLSFFRRLSPRSLFQLSFHFLRAENFTLFSTVELLLDSNSPYKVLLKSFCEADSLSRQIVEYKSKSSTKNRDKEVDKVKDKNVSDGALHDCRWTLSENLDFLSSESDSMLQRFQEGLNEYQLNGKRNLDLSRFIPKEFSVPVAASVHVSVCSFPFQSIALFSERLLVLDISNNFLTVFPPALSFFFQLQKLNLSHNKIQSLPQHLETNLSDLQTLDLTDNKFCVFPACVLNMKALEELRLGMNSLEYLPLQVKNLVKLQHLDISNNKFKVLSSDLTHIRFLKT